MIIVNLYKLPIKNRRGSADKVVFPKIEIIKIKIELINLIIKICIIIYINLMNFLNIDYKMLFSYDKNIHSFL